MIKDLREINRILIAIKQLSINEFAKKEDVKNECKKIVLGGKFPDHLETINFCISAGIILELNGQLKLLSLGKKLLKANPEEIWDLTELQKILLVEHCFLDGYCKEQSISILKQFLPDNKRQTFVFSKLNDFALHCDPIDFKLLLQTELILSDEKIWFVNPVFSKYLTLQIQKRKIAYSELEQQHKNNKEVGDIAEKIVMKYEKERLKNDESAISESRLVKIIGATDISAGYDVESFDGKTKNLEFNRHIEVKGSTKCELSFFWSSDQIEKAREKGDEYWIYFVPGIDRQNEAYNSEIIKIKNPAYEIIDSKKYSVECVKFRVTKNNIV